MKDIDRISDGRPEHDNFINGRLAELKAILRKLLESFIKFLFAANSGGIISVATFIKLDTASFNTYPKVAITSFVIGIFTTAILLIRMLIRAYQADKAWDSNTDQWYEGKLNWKELNDKDIALTHDDRLEFFLIFVGFGAFTTGTATLIFGIWTI